MTLAELIPTLRSSLPTRWNHGSGPPRPTIYRAAAGKALLTRAVARIVRDEGLSLDVCSEGELAVTAAADFPAERIILHGNAKPRALLWRARALGVGRIVPDSLDDIAALAAHAAGSGAQRVLTMPGVPAPTRLPC